MSVETTLVLFLLCSGFSHFASHHLRSFHLHPEGKLWNESLIYCNQSGGSLVTLYDEADRNFTERFSGGKKTWLGLKKSRNITWSNSVPVTFQNISVNVTKGYQTCVAVNNTTWRGFNCSERKPFMCSSGRNYRLIESKKSWCQALQHCRRHFDDLVSISNETQNQKAIEEGNGTSFWIGLMYDEWEWMDGSCSSFREWGSSQEGRPGIFTKFVHEGSFPMAKSEWDGHENSFCSKGTMRIKVIDLHLTWEQAFNYCKANHTGPLWIDDQEDQKAVRDWLTNGTDFGGPFWIGLRQSRVFGFWIWSDSMVNYSNWKNDTTPEIPMSHHCGAIENDGSWSDVNCLLQLRFLCEEEIVFMNKS
ncbi:hypothetical protein VZT92_016339 [Zoarces viviparus]|uniref:C-type lectin domain-containing protein n=1 Tax=Zoarces viviparus TaxID=48416 RepID=A0AAW1EWH1_ZOAVI